MQTLLVGTIVLTLALIGEATSRADVVCKELHCYCQGPDEPDTVASCDTTCEAVCAGTSAAATSARKIRLASWSLVAILGPSFTSHDQNGGSSTPDGGSYGVALEGHFGRPAFGILLRTALTSTPIEGTGVGLARERAFVFDWFIVGLEVSPRVVGGRSWALRPTAAVWAGWGTLLGCDGCDAAAATGDFENAYSDLGWGARLGFDLYLGVRPQRRGVSVAVVFSKSQVGDLDEYELLANSPTEHVAPLVMLQVGLISMPNGY